jgi:1-acyl-sn-glycerol-3-phosphate acyltransferase
VSAPGAAPPAPFQLSDRDRRKLALQRGVGRLCFPLVAAAALLWLRGAKRLRLEDAAAVRARFRALLAEARGPVLVCSNHLTLVDSLVLAWALAPARAYLRDYARLPWNVPERANFSRTPFWRVATFVGKCVYVTRGGRREEVRRSLAMIVHLLRSGELVSIFPEGGRSRTGRVDTEGFAYGAGQLVQAVPGLAVLCVYLRGRGQEGYSDFPRTGEVYCLELELLRPETPHQGLRGARDLATRIVRRLAEMEERHLAEMEARHPGGPEARGLARR